MAVKKDYEKDGKAGFTIENGDLEALNRIREAYDLKDSDDVIVFAIGLLSQGAGRPVTIVKDDGSTTKLLPADKLKRADENGGE